MSIAAPQGILCGRYTLLGKLGAGGQAEVWRARDLVQGGDLALKILLPAVATDAAAWAALEREHAIVSRLDHPLILKVWAPVRDGATVVLPMEFAPGGDLRRLRGVSYLEIVPVLIEVATALEHAHSRGVVHRDLKPGNVLFDSRGHVRLADFGIAGTVMGGDPDALRLPAGRTAVSPFTASPEQLRGEPPAVSDDVYGIGALAYELLSGYPPFYPRFDLRRVLEEPAPDLTPVYQAPPRLLALVMAMLAKQPADRPASMRTVVEELDATLNDTLTFDYATHGGTAEPPLPPRETPALEQASRTLLSPDFTALPWAADAAARLERAPVSLVPRTRPRESGTAERPARERVAPREQASEKVSARAVERPLPASRITHFEPLSRITTAPSIEASTEDSAVAPVNVAAAPFATAHVALGASARTPDTFTSPLSGSARSIHVASPPPVGLRATLVTPETPREPVRSAEPVQPPEPAQRVERAPLAEQAPPVEQTAPEPAGPSERKPDAAPAAPAVSQASAVPEPWDDLKIDVVPNLMRVEAVRHRRWPGVLLLMLAAAAIAAFFWLPHLAPQIASWSLPDWLQPSAHEPSTAGKGSEAAPDAATASSAQIAEGSAAQSVAGDTAAEAASNASGSVPTDNDEAPADDGAARARVDESRRQFESQLAALDTRAAGVWGGADYANAKSDEAQALAVLQAGDTASAQQRLQEALDLLGKVKQRGPTALAAQLNAGDQSLRAGNSAAARQAFELALRIEPDNHRARDGLARAKRLDGLLPLLADGENAQASGDYARAVQDYSQALAIDPQNQQAREALARAHAGLGADGYAKAVGTGYAALGAGRLEDARNAFEQARKLNPRGREAWQGVERVNAALQARGFAELRVRAASLESQERWGEALQTYDLALHSDPSLTFAQQGRARALEHAELSNRLQALVDEPQRLAALEVRREALQLIRQADTIEPSGPVMRSLATRLAILLPEFDKPVHLELLSDSETEVQIEQIGSFGTFNRRQIDLKPGRYTVIGTRAGYRDVRRQVTVAPGGDIQTINVRCIEPI